MGWPEADATKKAGIRANARPLWIAVVAALESDVDELKLHPAPNVVVSIYDKTDDAIWLHVQCATDRFNKTVIIVSFDSDGPNVSVIVEAPKATSRQFGFTFDESPSGDIILQRTDSKDPAPLDAKKVAVAILRPVVHDLSGL